MPFDAVILIALGLFVEPTFSLNVTTVPTTLKPCPSFFPLSFTVELKVTEEFEVKATSTEDLPE